MKSGMFSALNMCFISQNKEEAQPESGSAADETGKGLESVKISDDQAKKE